MVYACALKNLYCITKALISSWKTLYFINIHCALPSRLKTGYKSSLSHQTFSRLLSIVKILLAWKFFSSFFFLLLFLIYRPLFYARSFAIFPPEVLCDNIFGSIIRTSLERINEIHADNSLHHQVPTIIL